MSKILKFGVIFSAILLYFFAVQKVSATDWQTQTVDSSPGARDISMTIDNNGKIHISYATGQILRYTTNSLGSFIVSDVDTVIGNNTGGYTSIAVNSTGTVFISYYDGVDGDLMLATKISSGWTTQTVHGGGDIGKFSSLAIDSAGYLHISFFDSTMNNLVYTNNTSGAWVQSNLDSALENGVSGISMAIDSNNKYHIAYFDRKTNNLKYTNNSSWPLSFIDLNAGSNPSLKVDANNKLHVSYYDSSNGDLKYATNSSGSWVASTVDSDGNVGEFSSLAIGSDGAIYISYYRSDNGSIKFAANKSGSWITNSITDVGGGGMPNSLVLGSNSEIYVSYTGDNGFGALMIAYASGFSSATVSINSGLPYAFSRQVNLSFTTAGADPTQMIISENSDFSGASWETYAATKTFTLSSGAGTKTVYVKFRNVLGQESQSASDTISYIPKPKFVTKSAKKQNEVLIKKDTTNPGIQDMDLTFGFPKSFAKKKYYLQPVKFAKYPPKYANAKKKALKKYWQVDTDFNKFKKNLQLEFVYYYTNKEFKALKKQNKSLKEKDLALKYYDSSAKTWKELTAKHNAKKNSFKATFKKLLFARTYFGIGK